MRPALADTLVTRLVAFPEDARLVGVVFGDLVILFDSMHRADVWDLHDTATRSRFLGH